MRSFWMAAVAAAALVGGASARANPPVNPQPTTTHEAQPVSQVAWTERGELTAAPQGSTGDQAAAPESPQQSAPPQQAPPESGSPSMSPNPTAQPGATPAPGKGMGMNMQAVCPMTLPGTKVKAEDTSGGASLVFTTTSTNVSALRERVQKLADWHNQHSAQMRSRMGAGAGGTMKGMQPAPGGMPPALMSARAHVQHLRNGAQLIFTPSDPAQLTALRSEVKQHAQRMASGQCGMGGMGGMHGAGSMGGMSRPPPSETPPPPSNP